MAGPKSDIRTNLGDRGSDPDIDPPGLGDVMRHPHEMPIRYTAAAAQIWSGSVDGQDRLGLRPYRSRGAPCRPRPGGGVVSQQLVFS